jgi:alpha-tubulin N-acetyltransferase 1
MKYSGSKCIGILKIGQKKLFIQNKIGQTIEISPTCVLDFYVHESVQRGGHGKHLFEIMLDH